MMSTALQIAAAAAVVRRDVVNAVAPWSGTIVAPAATLLATYTPTKASDLMPRSRIQTQPSISIAGASVGGRSPTVKGCFQTTGG